MTLYVFLLFLHVLAAILAFGTAMLAFPFIGAFGEKEPTHLNFALRLSYALGRRAVTPLALTTAGLGVALVFVGDWDLWANEWLLFSIVLFSVTVADAQLVTLPTVGKLAKLTSSPADASPGDVAKLVKKVRISGSLSAFLLAAITLLMVWKPGG